MPFKETGFPGLFVFQPKVHRDERGFFLESYNRKLFSDHGFNYEFVQDNHARSEDAGVLRGLHFQLPPAAQTKLVRVSAGAVLDVVVDIRRNSPTFGKYFKIELTADNFLQLLVPRGFAHGYLVLKPGTEFQYKVDYVYSPENDSGIIWNDKDLSISWPIDNPILSKKDVELRKFEDFDSPFYFEG